MMADLGKSLKDTWMKSMEAIGNTATNIANNTKFRVNEMKLVNRRHEILSDFGARAYEEWQKGGVEFPEPLQALMQELSDVDEELNAIRAEHLAMAATEKKEEEAAASGEEQTAEEATAIDEAEDALDEAIGSIRPEGEKSEAQEEASEDSCEEPEPAAEEPASGETEDIKEEAGEEIQTEPEKTEE